MTEAAEQAAEQADGVPPPQQDDAAEEAKPETETEATVEAVEAKLEDLNIEEEATEEATEEVAYEEVESSPSEDDDSGGEWISECGDICGRRPTTNAHQHRATSRNIRPGRTPPRRPKLRKRFFRPPSSRVTWP